MKNIAMAVVVREGKVLIQKRFRYRQGMVFEFPGGSVDPGESGSQAAIRELWEETGLKDLQLLGTHQSQNDLGGEIHYIVLRADQNDEPKMVDAERQQTFYWLEPSAIPLGDFYRADIEFIEKHLSRFVSQRC
ncbi:NUDIX hydrolase [Vibrio lentus]|uniref:NUDIX hydrolase n=1 Tax=Vibrio lentus TaxID=136468 RepID=UPI000C841A4D|nr:NUDIX hydrolase [Vibrio lentus]PMG19084.1 DNA mismatch repair protein MutT [Vibrio lentus]PMH16509.1 DNA mismatch repair protein MutT [Vibrio lentus]PMJ12121.1 DNA mismatch repair protein MutT [Vibrio lentus]PMK94961.1 DNA mismatch repair protein MutT [Vibrio lentus]PMN17320.1 DNA mismatch repair protein MutT [Vibrio lentus]